MGLVFVEALLGPTLEQLAPVEFMVDTGAFYSFVPPDLAIQLGLQFTASTAVVMADGTQRQVPLGLAYLQLEDRVSGTVVGSMTVPKPLLGAITLQSLGLNVNTMEEVVEFSTRYTPPSWYTG